MHGNPCAFKAYLFLYLARIPRPLPEIFLAVALSSAMYGLLFSVADTMRISEARRCLTGLSCSHSDGKEVQGIRVCDATKKQIASYAAYISAMYIC